MWVLSEMKYTSVIQNGGFTMEDYSRPFFNSEVIMTWLLLLKIVNVFVNFLILTDTLLFKYLMLWGEKLMEFGLCQ